ncbi:MAG: hypothetical protein V4591_08735 [Bdellovibrionota bacterium]
MSEAIGKKQIRILPRTLINKASGRRLFPPVTPGTLSSSRAQSPHVQTPRSTSKKVPLEIKSIVDRLKELSNSTPPNPQEIREALFRDIVQKACCSYETFEEFLKKEDLYTQDEEFNAFMATDFMVPEISTIHGASQKNILHVLTSIPTLYHEAFLRHILPEEIGLMAQQKSGLLSKKPLDMLDTPFHKQEFQSRLTECGHFFLLWAYFKKNEAKDTKKLKLNFAEFKRYLTTACEHPEKLQSFRFSLVAPFGSERDEYSNWRTALHNYLKGLEPNRVQELAQKVNSRITAIQQNRGAVI